MSNRWLVLTIALAARLTYLAVKPANVYSDDVRGWKTVAATLSAGHNPYETGLLNWPPVWPAIIWSLDHVSRWSGIGFVSLIWSLLIAIELMLINVTYDLLLRFGTPRQARNAALVGMAVNPVAILQTTQHGNFDVLVALLILLSIRALIRFHAGGLTRRGDWLAAAGWMGAAAATKTVPLTLIPLFAAGIAALKRLDWIKGLLLLFAPVTFCMAAIFIINPIAVRAHVLNYRSFGEFYGFSGIAYLFDVQGSLPWLADAFAIGFPILLGTLMWRLWRRRRPLAAHDMIMLAGLVLLCIPTLGPGYANQYIYWYLPLFVISWLAWPLPEWRRLLVVGWIVSAATYCFEYAVEPNLGNLLIRIWPKSDAALALCVTWSDRQAMILDRLPLFAAQLALLMAGARTWISGEGWVPKGEQSGA